MSAPSVPAIRRDVQTGRNGVTPDPQKDSRASQQSCATHGGATQGSEIADVSTNRGTEQASSPPNDGVRTMADGDRAVGSKQDWRSVKCGHGFVLGGPCEGCRRCEHGVSAFGGVPCPMCTGINPLAESPRRDLVLGNDEPGLDLWREYAAAFLNTANVWDGDDGEPCEPDESMRNLGGMP